MAELFHVSRKQRIALRFDELLQKVERGSDFVVTDLDLATIKFLPQTLPLTELHDQIIVATALIHEAKVLTKNGPISDCGVIETIW